MTSGLPAANGGAATPSRWPIKSPHWFIRGERCRQASPRHSGPRLIHSPLSASSPSIPLSDRGLFYMHTHEHVTKNAHSHTNAEHLITLLTICRVLIETPLSPGSTCIPSLIISEGAFGEGRDGGGGGRRELPRTPPVPTQLSTDPIEINFAAMCWCTDECSGSSRGPLPSFQRYNI